MEDFDRLKAQKDAYMKAERPHRMSHDATQAAAYQKIADEFWHYEQKILCERERAGLTREQQIGAAVVLEWLQQTDALAQAKADGYEDMLKRAKYRLSAYQPGDRTAKELIWMIDYLREQIEARAKGDT